MNRKSFIALATVMAIASLTGCQTVPTSEPQIISSKVFVTQTGTKFMTFIDVTALMADAQASGKGIIGAVTDLPGKAMKGAGTMFKEHPWQSSIVAAAGILTATDMAGIYGWGDLTDDLGLTDDSDDDPKPPKDCDEKIRIEGHGNIVDLDGESLGNFCLDVIGDQNRFEVGDADSKN